MHPIRKRDIPILIANLLLAALLSSLHHWVAIAKNRGDYSPFCVSPSVSAMTFDETHAYAPLAQRFMSIGQLPAEVDNYERRNLSAGVPFFPAVILGTMGRVLGSLDRAFIIADVLFPALALALLFAASEGVIHNARFRLLLAWSILLIPWGPRTFFWLGYDSLLAAPDFTRTPQPEISFTLVLLALLVSACALTPSAKRAVTVVAGLVGALIVYSYYFYAIAWGMTLGLLLVVTLFWRNWALAKRVGVMLSVMVFASLPFIFATARGKVEGGQTYLLAREGNYTHAPQVVPLLCFFLGLFLVLKFGKRFPANREHQIRVGIFVLLLLAGIGGLNFQVLSGYDAQHGHFWNRLILPIAFFLCGCWVFSVAENSNWQRPRVLNSAAIGILVCMLLNAGARQVCVGLRIAEQQHATRPEVELLNWIRSNLPVGSVIGTVDPELILMIPAMGPNFTYVPTGLRSLTPTSEIVDRYYELASLLGLSTADVESIATRPYHHTTASQLFLVLGYVGTPGTFAEDYRRYRGEYVDQLRRLDYIVSSPGTPIPAGITERFIHAQVLHANRQYQLVGLQQSQLAPIEAGRNKQGSYRENPLPTILLYHQRFESSCAILWLLQACTQS